MITPNEPSPRKLDWQRERNPHRWRAASCFTEPRKPLFEGTDSNCNYNTGVSDYVWFWPGLKYYLDSLRKCHPHPRPSWYAKTSICTHRGIECAGHLLILIAEVAWKKQNRVGPTWLCSTLPYAKADEMHNRTTTPRSRCRLRPVPVWEVWKIL